MERKGSRLVLTWNGDVDGGDDGWEEGAGMLTDLIRIRDGLLAGDGRALYLGWLAGIYSIDEPETVCEPPVPPGMNRLDVSLRELADFLWIDEDLLAVASDPKAAGKFGTRTAAALLEAGDERTKVEAERARKEAAIKAEAAALLAAERRRAYLEEHAPRYEEFWALVHADIATRLPKNYDAAVKRLVDLRDIAAMSGRQAHFESRFAAFLASHQGKSSLKRKIEAAGLHE